MKLSIRTKLIAFTVCIILLVGGSISLYSIYQGRERTLQTFESDALQTTTLLSGTVINYLYFLDISALRRSLQNARVNPDINYTYVLDAEGAVLTDGTGQNPLGGQKLPDSFSGEMLQSKSWISRTEDEILKVGGPLLTSDGVRIGYLQVGYSLNRAYEIVRGTTQFSLYITLLCLVIGAVLAVIVATGFSRPIESIVTAALAIGRGDLDTRLTMKRGDEFATLAESINRMAEGLQLRGAESEEKTRQLQALDAIATATSQSLHLDDFFEIVLDKVAEVTGRKRVNIRAKDPVTGKIKLVAHRGFSQEEIEELQRRTSHERIDQVFTSAAPVVINNASETSAQTLLPQTRAVAWIPIKAGPKVVGVLGISDDQAAIFSPKEVELLLAIGNVVGVAMENARLFAETKRNLAGIRALHEIDMAITSTLELQGVLDILLQKIDLFLPYSTATVRLFNKQTGVLEPVACRNLDEKEWKVAAWKPGRGPANAVFESKAPLMIRNCLEDSRIRDPEFFRKHRLVSYLGVPMFARDEILGVLSFYTQEEHEFANEEVEFLITLAGQAAIAIHNSEVYEELAKTAGDLSKSNREVSALHRVAAAASQSVELDRVLQATIEKITEIFRFDATQIHLSNERAGELTLGAYFEKEPGRFASVRSFRIGQGIVGKVAESGKPLIFADVQTDPVYQQFSRSKVSGQFGYHFFAVFPIRSKLKNLGTLACTGVDPRTLDSGEIRLLEALMDQVAVAIENSQLYGEVREKVEELQQKTADLERANNVKDEFLSVMSHELRTPLNVVMGYTGMIKDGLLGEINPEQEKALEKVISRARDQLTMISSILQATQLEAEGVKVHSHEVPLRDFLEDLKINYSIPVGKELSLIWDYSPDLPAINTDTEKLKHILHNLINNAIKFTERGSVTISADYLNGAGADPADGRHSRGNGRSGMVRFRVRDTGVGIADEHFSMIFERFRQVDSSETRKYGGVGIGLYIVKKFTELLGGKVELESEPGKGSVFTVTVPQELPQVAGVKANP